VRVPPTGPGGPVRVVLIGFMGSGKSTVGALLADRLGWEFVDLDTLVETRAGCPISTVFATHGEQRFRDLESECLYELAGRSRVVIASGGGTPMGDANQWFFTDAGAAVFHLDVSLEEALTRTSGDASRPLLARGPEEVRQRYEARLPRYRELGTGIATDGMSPEEVTVKIAAQLAARTQTALG
jgi:shikimate kinase